VKCWIAAAAKKYGQPLADAYRVANCESSFDPNNSYAGHYGLFQFLPSTFATTPYRNRDIWSPKWNSLAAMWMWAHKRRSEWQCQ
jgi:soluble lytic murein transglycosylase-like protein